MHHIKVPLSITLPRKKVKDKKVSLNLNTYRNLHRFTEHESKDAYTNYLWDLLRSLDLRDSRIYIYYEIWYGRGGRHDKWNVVSIVQKYFLDALSYYWCVEDDNDDNIGMEASSVWGIDKSDPHCDIFITHDKRDYLRLITNKLWK